MAAFARRTKVRPKYDPYPHEKTHVHLPDGSHHEVEKTSNMRPSQDYNEELRELIDPWEKDRILEQAEKQKTKEWTRFVSSEKPLDRGGLRATRSNVDPSKVQSWDTFEITFDRADVGTPERQQAVFKEVVDWAKEIHTEGLEGGRRAFTIQEWHGLDGSSSRPHLRLEMHRVGWEPTPKLVPSNGHEKILAGKVQARTNYAEGTGEIDKDFQSLVATLQNKFGITLQVGSPSLDKESSGRDAAGIPNDPGAEAARIMEARTARETPNAPAVAPVAVLGAADLEDVEGVDLDQAWQNLDAPATTPTKQNDKPFELRKPENFMTAEVAEAFEEMEAAKKRFEALRLSQLLHAENAQLKETVASNTVQISDLQATNNQKDAKIQEKDQTIDRVSGELESEKMAGATWKDKAMAVIQKVRKLLHLERAARIEAEGQVQELGVELATERDNSAKAKEQAAKDIAAEQDKTQTVERERDTVKAQNTELSATNERLSEEKGKLAATAEIATASAAAAIKDLATTKEQAAKDISAEREITAKVSEDLKTATEQLAPLVEANKNLAGQVKEITEKNASLAQQVEALNAQTQELAKNLARGEQQQKTLIRSNIQDGEVLGAKLDQMDKLYDKMQQHFQHDPQALMLVQELSSIIKPRADYVSRVEAYIELGMPVQGEQQWSAFANRFKEVERSDGEFSKRANEITKRIAEQSEPMAPAPAPGVARPSPKPGSIGGNKPPEGDRNR